MSETAEQFVDTRTQPPPVRKELEKRRQRSLYRLVWIDPNKHSEYRRFLDENKGLIEHGQLADYTWLDNWDCRFYPEYPDKGNFGDNQKGKAIVLQTVYDTDDFGLYISAEKKMRYSHKSNAPHKVFVHTERMSKPERREARQQLLEAKAEQSQSFPTPLTKKEVA